MDRDDGDGDMLGYDRVRGVFEEVAGGSPQEVVDHLAATGRAWANGSRRDDDMTFVVLRVKGG